MASDIQKTSFRSEWPKALAPTPLSSYLQPIQSVVSKVNGSAFLQNMFAPMINPALKEDPSKATALAGYRADLIQTDGDYQAEIFTITAPDNTELEGVFFKGSSNQSILFAIGAGGRFESLADEKDAGYKFIQFFKEQFPGINILAINTRGIGNKTLPSLQGSGLDYYTAWNFLESKGLTVLPWGHSLGFRYVVEAAAWKQSENPNAEINIVSDRSFDDITNLAKQSMGGGVVGSIVGALGKHANWGGSALEQWNSLRGKKLILVAPEDGTIPFATASLYQRVLNTPNHSAASVIKLVGDKEAHTRIYNEEESQAISEQVQSMLNRSEAPFNSLIEHMGAVSTPSRASRLFNRVITQ